MAQMNKYFEFLCAVVNDIGRSETHEDLLAQLHETEFYSLVPNDHNRAEDGLVFRDEFLDMEGPQGVSSLPDGPCTVLEMMAGLAKRLEFETLCSDYERPLGEWFWILVKNLGLMECNNRAYKDPKCADFVDKTVEILLERRYSYDGTGGLFPLKVAQCDTKNVEIWYQMNSWLIENCPI